MKASNIESEIKGTHDAFEFGHIANIKLGLDFFAFEFCFCDAYGAWRKIDASYLPASARQRDNVRACAATEVNGFACGMGLDEFEEFGRGDAAIPGWFAEVPEVKCQTSKHFENFFSAFARVVT